MEQLVIQLCHEVFPQQEIQKIERLLGGRSNYMYKVTIQNEEYTVRIPGKNAEQFVNRANELSNMNKAFQLGLCSETIYFNVENGYKIAKYIDGVDLGSMDSEQYFPKVVEIMKKVHESNVIADNDYSPFERLKHYESINIELGFNHSNRYIELKNRLYQYKEYLESQPKVFCHGDSQLGNMILDPKEQIYLLDWEFAGNNDYFYDLACFGNNDFLDALTFLRYYLGRDATQEELKRLYLWRAFQAIQWHNVATYKHLIGLSKELHVDFDNVSVHYLDLLETLLNEVK